MVNIKSSLVLWNTTRGSEQNLLKSEKRFRVGKITINLLSLQLYCCVDSRLLPHTTKDFLSGLFLTLLENQPCCSNYGPTKITPKPAKSLKGRSFPLMCELLDMKTDSPATRESKHDPCVEIACNLIKNNDPSKKLNLFTLYRVLIIFHQLQAAQISRQIIRRHKAELAC